MIKNNFDIVIIGGGMVGLAIAYQIIERGFLKDILIIEKEKDIGFHSSGRNSGVLHSGIYYEPGSIKAKVCVSGAKRLKAWIHEKKIPIKNCGKVVIPQRFDLDEKLSLLEERGKRNGAKVEILDENQLKEIAPFAKSASGRGLWSPNTSVVNPSKVMQELKKDLIKKGVIFCMDEINWLRKIPDKQIILTNGETINYAWLINSAGFNADKIAHNFEIGLEYNLMPFKGTYWQIKKNSPIKVNTNIYPVPDLNVPFLGIHFTPNAEDSSTVSIGPTAIPALGRENYRLFEKLEPLASLLNFKEIFFQYLSNSGGFRNYAGEQMFLSFPPFFLKAAQELIPSIKGNDIELSKKVGIRAQLYNKKKKSLENDFICINGSHSTHILNAISPAFTASFSLADLIIDDYLIKGFLK